MKKVKFGNLSFDSIDTLSAKQKSTILGGAYGSNGSTIGSDSCSTKSCTVTNGGGYPAATSCGAHPMTGACICPGTYASC